MTSIKDHHDASRDQYISHKLYLERRAGNRYYNLGYMSYKAVFTLVVNNAGQNTYPNSTAVNILDAYKNFEIALLFNPNDVDAKARIEHLCKIWGPQAQPGPPNSGFPGATVNQIQIDAARNEAKKEFKNCKC
jgi:hypothetical protein